MLPRFLHRTMFIFWHRCGVVVLYSTLFLFNFLHFQHVSILNDLHRPWECLIQCILPEWVLTGKMRWLGNNVQCDVFFPQGEQTSWFTNFQRGIFSEQSILHLTSMEHLSPLNFFDLFLCFCSLTPPILYHVETQPPQFLYTLICNPNILFSSQPFFSHVLHVKQLGWKVGIEFELEWLVKQAWWLSASLSTTALS